MYVNIALAIPEDWGIDPAIQAKTNKNQWC